MMNNQNIENRIVSVMRKARFIEQTDMYSVDAWVAFVEMARAYVDNKSNVDVKHDVSDTYRVDIIAIDAIFAAIDDMGDD